MIDPSKLGRRIAMLRHAQGLTQSELAAQLGISSQAVSKWERGMACPDITCLDELAEIFGISIDALLKGKENEPWSF